LLLAVLRLEAVGGKTRQGEEQGEAAEEGVAQLLQGERERSREMYWLQTKFTDTN
tara:strand:+ start:198 stop:362 length:165 start_codon:yes stop_codon:yes gene_type:complete